MEHRLQCRTCLVDAGDLFEVYGETGMELSLPQKMHDHLRITIDQTDAYALMCSKCIGMLNEFHDMYMLAQEAQAQFLQLFDSKVLLLKNEFIEESHTEIFVEHLDGAVFEEEQQKEEGADEVENDALEEVIVEETIEEDPVIAIVDGETITYEAIDRAVYEEEQMDGGEEGEEEEDDGVTDEDATDDEASHAEKKPPRERRIRMQFREVLTPEQREEQNELIRSVVPICCQDCGHVADSLETLMFHIRQKHKKNAGLVCCEREFRKRVKLVEHVKLHLDPKAFSCSICDKPFSSKYTLNHHMTAHVPEELCEFICEHCPKKFSTKARLASHEKSHSDQNFECHICKKAYSQKCTLSAHIKHVHERSAEAFICEVCAKPFKTKEAFLTHQANHMEVPPPRIACPICSKKMKNRETLNQHILRHKRENDQHFCDICNKEFNCKKRLNQHKKYVHTTEKLQCEHCEKTFKRPIYLKEHMASHTGESLYTCSYCPRQFNSNANKYSHQKAQHPIEWQLAKQKRLEE